VTRRFPIPAPAESIAFRPDLKRVVTGHPDGTLTIRDTTSGDNVATFLASAAVPVRCLRFVGDDLIASTIRHALTRFEAGPIDTDLLARREELRQALGVIERLRPTAVHMSELATRIEREPTIPSRIREQAARVARTIGDHATLINNSSVIALSRFPALSEETLAAIDRDTQLATSRTNDPFALNVRGQALVRLGRFDEALDFLDRANQGFAATRPKWNPLTPSIHLFRVLALAGAGRRDEAREALAAFESANADKPDPAITSLLEECRAAVARAK
jgi:tetratricopeptide (TPR) repeat protein